MAMQMSVRRRHMPVRRHPRMWHHLDQLRVHRVSVRAVSNRRRCASAMRRGRQMPCIPMRRVSVRWVAVSDVPDSLLARMVRVVHLDGRRKRHLRRNRKMNAGGVRPHNRLRPWRRM